ncbi:hypothetical protein MKW92_042538 [Papaver armeniacum]|nr:hypothetical protein MKW92_042538 [Papaver armeniacum]
MKRMTLEEKIGQMTQIERGVASAYAIKNWYIGSVLSGGGSVPGPKATARDWVNMVNGFQKGALSTRLGIPMIYGIDAVHGHGNVYKATIFPHNVGLGVTRDPELIKKIGAATALEVRAVGIPYVFAPCIAVCRDPRWGRCYESYSEDPKIVQLMTEIISGLQGEVPKKYAKGVPFVAGKNNVAACAKHFVGDGGTTKGINENNTVISRKGLSDIHMPAYCNSVYKGVSTIMVSYNSWNGIKMHTNKDLITGFSRTHSNSGYKSILISYSSESAETNISFTNGSYQGFVISDWEGIDRITSPPHANYTYSILAGINAGIDMIMVPNTFHEFIAGLTKLVEQKFIKRSRIDDAVSRILRVKFTMGLFENPIADFSLTKELGSQEHRDLAREAVRKSLVLLKNGNSAAYPIHANNLGNQCGGWTITWQGLTGNNLTYGTYNDTPRNQKHRRQKNQSSFQRNPDAKFLKNNKFSYAIVIVGEPPYAEQFGDSMNLTISEPGPSTIKNVCGAVKCVVVVVSGRPVVIQPYLAKIEALVAAWFPGTEGQGIADVLFGDYGFTGKLARTWFKSVNQLPMNVGDKHYDPLSSARLRLVTKPKLTLRNHIHRMKL